MRRYRAFLVGSLIVAAVGCGLAAFFWALVQVPEFYGTALDEQPEPAGRQEAARAFEQRTLQLVEGIQHADEWSEEFTQTQINSWLAEELHPKFGQLVPAGVSDPQVLLAGETIEIGFRYRRDHWNSVVSVRVRPWVPQPNRLAFEIESIRAGLVPIPLEHILHELSDHFETDGWRVEWNQTNGNDVMILHLDRTDFDRADRLNWTSKDRPVLEGVQVVDKAIRVTGRRLTPSRESNAPARKTSLSDDRAAE
jgi:hypothetical protein